MKRAIITLFCASCIVLTAGCSQTSWLYRVPVQQGNVLTVDTISQLHVGMTKEAVCDLLGPPVLCPTFGENRWSYIYTYKSGRGKIINRTVFIYFRNDRICTIDKHNI